MITITETAGDKIKELMAEKEGTVYLRVGVKTGGCLGLSYRLTLDEEVCLGDIEAWEQDIPIVVDRESDRYLDGAIIDYKESLLGTGFIIHNPNAVNRCGCGSSFNIEGDTGEPSQCRRYRL